MRINKSIVAMLLVLSMVLSLPCAVFAEDTAVAVSSDGTNIVDTFSEDFSNGLADWNKSGSKGFSANPSDGLLFNNMKEYMQPATITSVKNGIADFKLDAEITPKNGDYAGIYLRYESEDYHYLLQFYFSTNKVALLKKSNGGLYTVLQESKFTYKYGTPFNVSIVAKGDDFVISMDGTTSINCADTKSIYSGNIGIRGFHSVFAVKKISAEMYEASADDPSNETKSQLVDLGMPKSYKALPYDSTTKERFETRRKELGDEIKVLKNFEVKGKTEIFVSPTEGNDSNDGTIDKPLKTIPAAVKLALQGDVTKGVVIWLREGVYESTSVLSLTSIKGSANAPIFISGYKDEKAVFIGGYKLGYDKFEKVTDKNRYARLDETIRDKIKVIDLKAAGVKNIPAINGQFFGTSLYMDGNTCTLARYPNVGYCKVEKVVDQGPLQGDKNDGRGFTIGFIKDDEPLTWKDDGDIWVRGGFYYEWNQVYANVSFNIGNSTMNSGKANSPYGVKTGADFYFYNVFDDLNFPGEYYIDRDNMKLYFYPIGDLNEDSQIYLSVLEKGVPLIEVNGCSNIVFNNINFEAGTNEAVQIKESEDVVFQNSVFQNFGSNEVVITNSKRCGILSSVMIKFGDRAFYTGTGVNYSDIQPMNNFLMNCAINGNKDQVLHSTTSFTGVGEVQSHCLMSNGYATGIGTGGAESVYEYNEICAAPKYQYDSGGTYTAGVIGARAVHIRYYYVHDILPKSTNSLTRALYLDEMASDCMVYGNIMYKTPAGFFSHGGRDIAYYNNVSINLNAANDFAFANSRNMYNPESVITKRNWQSMDWAKYTTNAVKNRWPSYYKWLLNVTKVVADYNKNPSGWVRNDEYNEVVAPENFYVANNVSALGGGVFTYEKSVDWDQTEGLETNYTCEEDPFVDSKNQNFNLKDDNEITKNVEGFEEIPFDKIGLMIGEDYMKVRPYMGQFGEIFPFSPAQGEKSIQYPDKVQFMWTDVIWANRYRLEVATDPDFDNVVYDEVDEYEYATVDLKEAGKTFYWRVTAYTLCKSVDPTPLKSEVFSFTTMTEEEVAKHEKIVTGELAEKIDLAVETMNQTDPDEINEDITANFYDVIRKAQRIAKNPTSQKQVDDQIELISRAMNTLKTGEVYGYTNLTTANSMWVGPATNQFVQNYDPSTETLTFGAQNATQNVECQLYTKWRKIYRFQMKIENFKNWWGITTHWDPAVRSRYFYVMKPEQIELQIARGGKSAIIQTTQNNGEYIKDNTWQEYEIGQVMTEDGMWCYMAVDGKQVFSFIDDKPSTTEGHFQFMLNPNNGNVSIRPSQNTDTTLPEIPTFESLNQTTRMEF